MRKTASCNRHINRARFGGVNQGLIYVLVGVVVVVLLALPMIHKMNNDGEGVTEPVAENNTQTQTYQDPVVPSEWRTDYEAIKEHAEKTGQVLLIYVYNEDSDTCKMIEKEVFGNEKFQKAIVNCLKVKVHVDERSIIETNRRVIEGSLVFFKSPKYEVMQLAGYREASDISSFIESMKLAFPADFK